MADKLKRRNHEEDDDRYNDIDDREERGRGESSKYEKLYGVIDAFIDQVDMPRNRNRAIKYGIRALGELLSERDLTGTSRKSTNSGGSSSASHNGSKQRRG